MSTEGIQLGPLTLGYFGLIVAVGVGVVVLVGWLRAQPRSLELVHWLDLLTAMMIGGLIGGRLFYVLMPPPSVAAYYSTAWYLANPLDLQAGPLALWAGGLSHGGVVLGALVAALSIGWRKRLSLPAWLDVSVPALLAGLTLTPLANLINRQMLGLPSRLLWAVEPGAGAAYAGLPEGVRLHPLPAYAALISLVILVTLLSAECAAKPVSGVMGFWAALAYLAAMFFADFFRLDVPQALLRLSDAQLGAAVAGLLLIAVTVLAGWPARNNPLLQWMPSRAKFRSEAAAYAENQRD